MCFKIIGINKIPVQWEKASSYVREKYINKYNEYKAPVSGREALNTPKINIHKALDFILGMNKDNCKKYRPQDLTLNGNVDYGAKEFFDNEAKMAVRLANFISAFLQISDPNEVFSGKRVPDKSLTEDQMIAETMSLVLGNSRIWSAGTYWERNKFTNRTHFAPYAYKKQLNTRKFYMEDLARLNKTDEIYTNKEWFKNLKQRWSTNFDALEKYYLKIRIRFNETGETTRKYEHYPNFYRAAKLDHGYWTTPYFDCNGKVPMWKIKYGVPFFGWDSLKAKLEFKYVQIIIYVLYIFQYKFYCFRGMVAVTMNLLQLDINQCPDEYYVPNVFKGTHKCDEKTSYVSGLFLILLRLL